MPKCVKLRRKSVSEESYTLWTLSILLRPVTHTSSPLLLVQQGEQRTSRDILGDDGKLAGVVQTGPNKVDDTGVVEATEDGNLSAEHVHV